MKKIFLILLVAVSVGFLTSCGGDDTPSSTGTSTGKLKDGDKANLYDKVWYSTSSAGGIDHEFLSDGTFRLSQSLDGRWTWKNNGDTMDIVDNAKARYQYIFQTISSNSMSFKTSIDGFATTHSYKDTE